MERWLHMLRLRLRSLLRGRALDRELEEELQDHLSRQAEVNLVRGMAVDEANRAARVALGGIQQKKEMCRDARGLRWLHEFARDVRYAWRTYRRAPGFAATALVTLGLGIGSNTAVFSLLNALALRDLPVRDPDALVRVQTVTRDGTEDELSYDAFRLLIDRVAAFSAVTGWWGPSVEAVAVNDRIDRAGIFGATANAYDLLGVRPAAGRLFVSSDMTLEPPLAEHVAVLGYDCSQRLFGSVAGAVGQVVRIQKVPFTIVGVTPPGFTGLGLVVEPEVTIPLTAVPLINGRSVESLVGRPSRWITTVGRLHPGVRLAQARAQLAATWPHVRTAAAALGPATSRDETMSLGIVASSAAKGIEPNLRERYTRPLVIAMLVALLIMLIASLNFAGLVLARTTSRWQEFRVRLALGAGPARVTRQLLTEALLLAVVGMVGGLLFANITAKTISAVLLHGVLLPIEFNPAPDARVFVFAAGLAMSAALIVSLAPAWHLLRSSTVSLRSDTRTTSGRRGLSTVLMMGQIAATVVLLMTAGLLVRTLQQLRSVDSGLRSGGVAVLYPEPIPGGYAHVDNDSYLPELVERIAALPGVTDVSVSLYKPGGRFGPQEIVSAPASAASAAISAFVTPVSPGFFRTLGLSVLQGRDLSWSDNSTGPAVALLSRSLADRLFGSADAPGRRIRIGVRPPYTEADIVGIVSDAQVYDIRSGNRYALYTAALQQGEQANYKALLIRADPQSLPSIRTAVASLGHDSVLDVDRLSSIEDQAILPERLTAALAGFFGLLGLLVAGIGLYGRMSYEVTQRAREIGIRMALGAESRRVMSGVVRDGLAIAVCGATVGFAAGPGAVRLVRSLLFGVGPYDPMTLACAVAIIFVIAAVACARPALRAARVDPLTVLRQE